MSLDEFVKAANKRVKKNTAIAEVDIEDPFVTFAKRHQCQALKLIIKGQRAFPDRTVLTNEGEVFFIEFKRLRKKLTTGQKRWRRVLIGLGFKYYVCDEKGQAEKILIETLDGSRIPTGRDRLSSTEP